MKTIVSFVFACSLAAATSLSPAHAGEPRNPSETASLFLALSLAVPLNLSATGASAISEASSRSGQEPRAAALPAMKVTAVRTAADGGREVELVAHHEGKDETSTLRWPKRNDDPAAAFRIGETVVFEPSSEGSGWMLQDEDGIHLAFVPTVEAAGQAGSEAL